eukprot:2519627-Karenia_brevis.AAC.1
MMIGGDHDSNDDDDGGGDDGNDDAHGDDDTVVYACTDSVFRSSNLPPCGKQKLPCECLQLVMQDNSDETRASNITRSKNILTRNCWALSD